MANKQNHYQLMGRPESGYTMKVRSAMRYKNIAYEYLDRFGHDKLFKAHAKVPLIPLLLRPDGSTTQDSTPILEEFEEQFPSPALHPEDAALKFLSDLIEEYGDEWGNKLMFHYRWGYPADQKHRSKTLAAGLIAGRLGKLGATLFTPIMAPMLVKRMVPRMAFAGANPNNAPILEESFATVVAILQKHLQNRLYLFGARPAFGDFGLWGQLHQAHSDPTCKAHLKQHGPAVVQWIERMLTPIAEGEFETFDSLTPTLRPLFEREIGPRFLAWDAANAQAFAAGEEQTELTMDGKRYYQKTFKYPAGAFALLQSKYDAVKNEELLTSFLEETGCLTYLQTKKVRTLR